MNQNILKKYFCKLYLIIPLFIITNCIPGKIKEPKWTQLWENKFDNKNKRADKISIFVNDKKGEIYCITNGRFIETIDLKNGKALWGRDFQGNEHGLFEHPLFMEDILYFGNFNGNYYAIDTEKKEFLFEVISERTGEKIICISPQSGAIKESTIVIGGTQRNSGRIQGLNSSTGEVLWDTTLADCPIFAKPAYDVNCAYFIAGEYLIAIDYRGQIKWKYHGEYATHKNSFPVLSSEVIYYSSPSKIFAIKANNGAEIWKKEIRSRAFVSLLIFNQYIYLFDEKNIFYCLNSSSGKIIWKSKLPKGDIIDVQPSNINNFIIFTLWDGTKSYYIYFLNSQTGETSYKIQLPVNEIFKDPILVLNNILYIQSQKEFEDEKGSHYVILRAIKLDF